MNSASTNIRPSVAADAALLALVPLGLNILRLLDPNGSKLPGIAVLILILFKNMLLQPGVSWAYQRRTYQESLAKRFDMAVLCPLLLMLILVCISVWRALGTYYTFSNVLSNIALLMLGLVAAGTAYLHANTDQEKRHLLKSAPIGIFLLVLANIVGFLIGFRSAPEMGEDRLNQTLSLVGVSIGRVFFPLTVGTNAFGSVCALGVVSSLLLWSSKSIGAKFLCVLSIAVCFLALVAVDSRAAMLAVLAAGLWLIFFRAAAVLRYIPLVLVVLTPLVPFVLAILFRLVNENGLLAGLVRTGSQGARLGVGTGRQYIWETAGSEILKGDLMHLIGYGAYGPAQSGFSTSYAWIFNQLGQTAASVHNTALQIFFDMGYVGVIIWVWCLFAILLRASRLSFLEPNKKYLSVLLAIFLFLLLQMQTEAVATIYAPEIIFFFIIISVAVASFSSGNVKSPSLSSYRRDASLVGPLRVMP